jgi:RimJ/RimL family protein N-acetyltransferase
METVELRDEMRIGVRPIEPADRERLHRAFHRLSPESRYRRFFAPLTNLSERDLTYLTEIDHHDHEALAALDPATDEIVGVARYVRGDEPHLAEASIVVADDWQHRGVATALLERLAPLAREAGITHFVALVLSENRDAIELFRHFAPTEPPRRSRSGNLEIMIELPAEEGIRGTDLGRALRDAARGLVTMNPWRVLAERIQRIPRVRR